MEFNVTPMKFKIVKLETLGPDQGGKYRGNERFLAVLVIGNQLTPVYMRDVGQILVEFITDKQELDNIQNLIEKYSQDEEYFKENILKID